MATTDPTAILGIGTAQADYVVKQADLARSYDALLSATTGNRRAGRRARLLFAQTKLESRQFAIPDVVDLEDATLYGAAELPTTEERMAVFSRLAPALAQQAAERALDDAGVSPEDIATLVVATCTGVGAPDLDVELVQRLGLPATVERSQLVWMSCSAAFPSLRIGRRAVSAGAGPALVVCVELCSLHVRADDEIGSLVAHGLFADGASAVVVGIAREQDSLAILGDAQTQLFPKGREALQWTFSDHGFRAHLGPDLPEHIEMAVPSFVEALLGGATAEVRSWCTHPGGPAILDAVERALSLEGTALSASREILTTLGNMSSATLFYVLERELPKLDRGDLGVLLGFGVGLTLEGLVFRKGGRTR